MDTVFGKIIIKVNGNIVDYITEELPNKTKCFCVDKRYKLYNKIILDKDDTIECLIEPKDNIILDSYLETGEALFLVSFYWKNFKMSIGTLGDQRDRIYEYEKNGIKIQFKERCKQVDFCVSWLQMYNEEIEDIYTWLASDPLYN